MGELYANRFYKYYSDSNNPAQLLSQSANSEEDDNEIFEYGKFNDGTFPPYLGRIVPTQEGMILVNHVYFQCNSIIPLDILDAKEMQRRKRSENASTVAQEEDEVELSEYEKLRAERVARNQERLKMLGL